MLARTFYQAILGQKYHLDIVRFYRPVWLS